MRRKGSATRLALGLLCAGLAFATPLRRAGAQEPAPAAPKAWDQARMIELTEKLAKAAREVRQTYRREPAYTDPQGPNRRAAQNMEEILHGLEQSSRQLHERVKGGGGRAETEGIARKMGTQLRDAEVEGRQLMSSEWLEQKVRPAKELINEIAPYYGAGPLYDPESLKPVER
jgi:hypothetical protein